MSSPLLHFIVTLDTGTFAAPAASVVTGATACEINLGLDLDSASCTVTFASRPAAADEGVFLYVNGGLDAEDILFNGEIDEIDWSGNTVRLICTDYLSRLRQEWGDTNYEYASQLASVVRRNLIEKSGVPSSLHHVEDSTWTLGVAQAVPLKQGDVPLSILREIDKAELWWTACKANGAIYSAPIALGTPVASYSDGDGQVVTPGISRHRSRRGIVNACRVEGLTIAGLALESLTQASNSYVTDPPKYYTETLSSYLIEDQTFADTQSAAVVAMKNMRPETFLIPIELDGATVQVGDTITITSSTCEVSSLDVFVVGMTHSIPACVTLLRAIRLP